MRCVVGWRVLWQRDKENFQDLIDKSPKAKQYFIDEFPLYSNLVYYPGKHTFSVGKTLSQNNLDIKCTHTFAVGNSMDTSFSGYKQLFLLETVAI